MSPIRRRRLFLALGGLLLLKHWLFGEYGPFDRVVELAVLGAILYEIIAEVFRRRADAKHKRFIDQQAIELMQCLAKGQRWLGGVPNTSYCNPHLADQLNTAWIKEVQAWIRGTNSILLNHSPKASEAFTSTADAGHVSTVIGSHPHTFIVRGHAETWYVALTVHLENLQRIITTPEAYFEYKRPKRGWKIRRRNAKNSHRLERGTEKA